jgi:hypothetical protein
VSSIRRACGGGMREKWGWGVWLGPRPRGERRRGGLRRHEGRLVTWAGMTWTRQERAMSMGRRRVRDVTHRRGRGVSGARCQQQGAGGREKSNAAQRRGANMRVRPAQCRVARFKLGLKPVQNYSNGSNEIRIPLNFG